MAAGCEDGGLDPGGYGTFKGDGLNTKAHRWIYERIVGPIEPGLQLDHQCAATVPA